MKAVFPERIVNVAGEDVTVRALSFHELMVEVPELVGRMVEKILEIEGELAIPDMIRACSGELFELLKRTAGKEEEAFWKEATAAEGLDALAAFAELNLTENFFLHLQRLAGAARGIGSTWSRLFSNPATAGGTSVRTALARLRDSSRPLTDLEPSAPPKGR